MTLGLGDAEVSDEVFEAMMLQLRQECLRDFQSVVEAHVRHSGTNSFGFAGDDRQVEATDIVSYPRILPAENVELG